jgi:hypothetical protein
MKTGRNTSQDVDCINSMLWTIIPLCSARVYISICVLFVHLKYLSIFFFFSSLDHASSNYDENKTNEMHFQFFGN